MFRDRACFDPQARIEWRLSTTGLITSEVHVNAEAVENIHDGLTRFRVERIDKASDEELDTSHESIVILIQWRDPNLLKSLQNLAQ